MKTRIAYVLISRKNDYYTEQIMLSISSLLLHNPKARIVIVCDTETEDLIYNNIFFSNKDITIYSFEFPNEIDLKARSRILKTTLRNRIEGNFLFIDTDTIICKSLEEIDGLNSSIAMVYDCNRNNPINILDKQIIERCKIVDDSVDVIGFPYFNSGIIYSKDDSLAHTFYNEWHSNWIKSYENGIYFDQPSLCLTNIKFGLIINRLTDSWNCQFKYDTPSKNAHILHYFNPGSGRLDIKEPFEYLIYDEIRKSKGLSDNYLLELLNSPTSTLSTIMQIQKDSLGEYCSSPLIDIWFNNRKLFRLLEKAGSCAMSIKRLLLRKN